MIELPPYTQECRLKQCPGCKTPVELREACNHMSCVCSHEYWFVCLVACDDEDHSVLVHDCPSYGDPPYDENGRDPRGLHVRTGLDEGGYNRLGRHENYPSRAPPLSLRAIANMADQAGEAGLGVGGQEHHEPRWIEAGRRELGQDLPYFRHGPVPGSTYIPAAEA